MSLVMAAVKNSYESDPMRSEVLLCMEAAKRTYHLTQNEIKA